MGDHTTFGMFPRPIALWTSADTAANPVAPLSPFLQYPQCWPTMEWYGRFCLVYRHNRGPDHGSCRTQENNWSAGDHSKQRSRGSWPTGWSERLGVFVDLVLGIIFVLGNSF